MKYPCPTCQRYPQCWTESKIIEQTDKYEVCPLYVPRMPEQKGADK